MIASTYCILLLLIPETVFAKNFFGLHSDTLQEHANRTNREGNRLTHLPTMMLHLYNSYTILDSRHGIELTPSIPHNFPSASQTNIIRSMAAKSIDKMGERFVLVFDFSSLNHNEDFQFAELQICSSVLKKHFGDGKQVIVDIFHQTSSCQESNELCKKRVYLGEFKRALLSRASDRWEMANVTEMVSKWFDISKKSDVQSTKEKEKFPGLRSDITRNEQHTFENQKVLMFVYSNPSKNERSSVTASLLLDATQSKYLATIPNKKNIISSIRPRRSPLINYLKMGMMQASNNLCRRVDFIIEFKILYWDKWIIHPKKYNAYRCEGTCPSPVNESVRPNNHAYLQSLLNYYNRAKAPEVCCVPTKYSGISMVYFDRRDIVFQHQSDMIVEECGCQ